MTLKSISVRETGSCIRKGPNCTAGLSSLGDVVEKFTCCPRDEHRIEGQEAFGDLIPPFACAFSKVNGHLLAVTDEEGGVLILNTHRIGLAAVLQDWRAHSNAVFDVDWMPGEDRLLTASGDQTVLLWDVETEETLGQFKGHTSSVKTARFRHDDKFVFASGSRDGHIMVWDTRMNPKHDGSVPAVNTIHNAHTCNDPGSASKKRRNSKVANPLDTQQSVTAVVFVDDNSLVSAGTVDGTIKVWDLRINHGMKTGAIPKETFPYAGASVRRHGFSHLVLDSSRTRLFASCLDNCIYQFSLANYNPKPVACYRGHQNDSFYVRTALSPDDLFLLSGSKDHHAYLWRVDDPLDGPFILKGHAGEVSSVGWCPQDFTKVVTISDDCTVRLWRVQPEAKAPQPGEVVGTCERTHKQIGVGVSSKPAASPRRPKPQMNRPKPLSPAARNTLVAMTTGSLPSSGAANAMKAETMVSPTIKKWFCKMSPKKAPLAVGSSPRKIHVILSPRKHPISQSQNVLGSPSQGPRPKRKLNISPDSMEGTPFKRRLLCPDENSLSPQKIPPSPVQSGTLPKVLSPCPSNLPGAINTTNMGNTPRKLFINSDQGFLTPVKEEPETKPFQSPTVNLPNYVMDPRPRTPVGRSNSLKENAGAKTPDWLTQLRHEKQGSAEKPRHSPALRTRKSHAEVNGEEPVTPKTKTRSGGRNSPMLSKTPSQSRRSIMEYFSPKSKSKSAKQESTEDK